MRATSKVLSIIAYYLSEYDMDAVKALGYRTRTEAMKSISVAAGRDNNYLKLRRDEFDALPNSSSPRKGWRNRAPLKEVEELGTYLHTFSFYELTEIVESLIKGFDGNVTTIPPVTHSIKVDDLPEEELEQIINFSDPNATIEVVTKEMTHRVCNTAIVHRLKKLYGGNCQLCGLKPFADIGADICEAHHIEYYSATHNNDANNIIILCPNHHRLLHKLNPIYDSVKKEFVFEQGKTMHIKCNFHLDKKE